MVAAVVAFGQLALALALTLAQATPAPESNATPYRATLLAYGNGLVFLSGGDALALDAACACERPLRAGTPIFVTIDPATRRVTRIVRTASAATGREPIPRRYVVTDPTAVKTRATDAAVRSVIVTIVVRVPDSTPPTDDIYLSTDRTGWSAAGQRMDRVDALHWSAKLQLADGAKVLYRFSRGSFNTLERNRAGALPDPRELVARENLVVDETVVKWADQL